MVVVRAMLVTELLDFQASAGLLCRSQDCRVNVSGHKSLELVLGESAAVSWTLIAIL